MAHYSFGGEIGKVIRGLWSLSSLVTVSGVTLVVGLLWAGIGYLTNQGWLPSSIAPLLATVILVPVVGRFALQAKEGRYTDGLLLDGLPLTAILRFSLNLVLLTLAGAILVALVAWLLARNSDPALLLIGGGGAWQLMLGFVAGVAAGTYGLLSVVVALEAESPLEAFRPSTWTDLLAERGGDLPVLIAGSIGSYGVFGIFSIPIFLAIAASIQSYAPLVALFVGGYAYVSPLLASPVILGRLCGAFVYPGHLELNVPEEPTLASASKAPPPNVVPMEPRPMVSSTPNPSSGGGMNINRLRTVAESDPVEAYELAAEMRKSQPNHSGVLFIQAQCALRAGRDNAMPLASETIRLAFRLGTHPVAQQAYAAFRDRRSELTLADTEFEFLGRVLLEGGALDDAIWSFRAAEHLGLSPMKAQKALVAVAERALVTGRSDRSSQVYGYLLKRYPDSEHVEFWREGQSRAQRQAESPEP